MGRPPPVRLCTSLFHLASLSERENRHWEEKMLSLIKLGVDPQVKNAQGQTACDLMSANEVDRKEKWESIVRALSARKQMHELLHAMTLDSVPGLKP